MQDRSSKRPKRGLNEVAASAMDDATAGEPTPIPEDTRDPAAVALGRKGGLKGGKARAAKLSAEERSAIARKAAVSRWDRRE